MLSPAMHALHGSAVASSGASTAVPLSWPGLMQIANTAMGIKSVERLAALAAPALIAISIWMYFTLEEVAATQGINIWTYQATGEMSLMVLFVANMSFWSTMAVDIPNLTRFLKPPLGLRVFSAATATSFSLSSGHCQEHRR